MGTILPLPIYSAPTGHTRTQETLQREHARAVVRTTFISLSIYMITSLTLCQWMQH